VGASILPFILTLSACLAGTVRAAPFPAQAGFLRQESLLLQGAIQDWRDFLADRPAVRERRLDSLLRIRDEAAAAEDLYEFELTRQRFDAWKEATVADLYASQSAPAAAVARSAIDAGALARLQGLTNAASRIGARPEIFDNSAARAGQSAVRPRTGDDPDEIARDLRRAKPEPSESLGTPQNGRLRHGMELPMHGLGYAYVHPGRGRNFGSDELVMGLASLAAGFLDLNPGHPGLRIGDLSRRGGGSISCHASHANGLDADIIFLASDQRGHPVDQPQFLAYDNQGRRGALRLDSARNWELLVLIFANRHLGPHIDKIFLGEAQRRLILAAGRRQAARAAGSEKALLELILSRAEETLMAWPHHADHFHIRLLNPR
jgi:penicillin-insensitive murein endopeptidase